MSYTKIDWCNHLKFFTYTLLQYLKSYTSNNIIVLTTVASFAMYVKNFPLMNLYSMTYKSPLLKDKIYSSLKEHLFKNNKTE